MSDHRGTNNYATIPLIFICRLYPIHSTSEEKLIIQTGESFYCDIVNVCPN